MLLEEACRDALDASAGVHVADDDRSGRDDGSGPDLEAVGDDGSHADDSALADPDVARDVRPRVERRGGRDRDMVTDE